MTKSQNTKNEQQKDLCITSEQLTEQWKKGELPEGFYYVNDGAEVTIDYYLCDYWERHFDYGVQQVLAPVPSYEEWMEKTKSLKVLAKAYCKEKQKNDEIKELLKECRRYIDIWGYTDTHGNALLPQIDEALQ